MKENGCMRLSDWRKTPYANTSSRSTLGDISNLMSKYEISDHQVFTQSRGGRFGIGVRFRLDGRIYRFVVRALDCPDADPAALERQAQRALYWSLKSLLEMSSVFVDREALLLAFAETGTGETVHEIAKRNPELMESGKFPKLIGKT